MIQETQILEFLNNNQGWPYTPKQISKQIHIPIPTVRKHLAAFLKIKAVGLNPLPQFKHYPEYYTNDLHVKNYLISLKKQKSKLLQSIAQTNRRMKIKNDKHK